MSDRPRAFDLFLLAPLGIAVVAYQLAEPGEIVPPVALVACVVARAVQDATGWVLSKATIAVAVAAAIVYVLLDVVRNDFQVTLFADFMMILAALKAMERRTPRDDGQLLVVSIFVALSAAVSSNRMGTGVLLVVYLFALMLAVMRMQIDAAMWPATPKRRGKLWPLLGVCVAGSTVVAVIAFVLLPRNAARWSSTQFSPVTQRVSGFRESVELGRGGLISLDPTQVMRVSPTNYTGEQAEPFDVGTPLYLRGIVLSDYESGSGGGRWSRGEPSEPAARETLVLPGTPVQISSTDRPATLRVVQFAGASSEGTVFTLWRPTFVNFDQAEGTLVYDTTDLSMRFDRPPAEKIEYRITYGPDAEARGGRRRGLPPATSGSEVLRSAAELALERAGIEPERRRRPMTQDVPAVQALADWLRTSKTYTLEIERAPAGRDPTEWFVAEADAGHCEYFASSLALLCREVGINSRVATGYLAVVEDPESEFTRVRRSDAHAWVEAEVAPGMWSVFDATPAAQGGDFGASVSPLARWFSSIESVWLASFISFDARSQSSLSRSLQQSLSFQRFDMSSEDPGEASQLPLVRIIAGVALFGIVSGCIVALRRINVGSRLPRNYTISPKVLKQRDDLEQAWIRAGSPRPPGTTLTGHAATLGEADADRARHLERLAFAAKPGTSE